MAAPLRGGMTQASDRLMGRGDASAPMVRSSGCRTGGHVPLVLDFSPSLGVPSRRGGVPDRARDSDHVFGQVIELVTQRGQIRGGVGAPAIDRQAGDAWTSDPDPVMPRQAVLMGDSIAKAT